VKAAFLFPGQGSEAPCMGGEALRRPGPVRRLLAHASSGVGLDLEAIIARGDPALGRTEVCQPALIAVGIGLGLEVCARGAVPDFVAGHSVGEIAAFCVAGCLDPEEAIDCAIDRGRLMAEAARRRPGGMVALRVRTEEEVQWALEEGRRAGSIAIAAHNSPAEWVLTGDRSALAAVAACRSIVVLPVGGPWHSPAMADAARAWRPRLDRIRWRRPLFPLVANATGRLVGDDDDLVELLVGQLTSPVRWAETMRTLGEAGVKAWHILGPGRVLRGLCRSNAGMAARIELHEGLPALEARS
jgi:[acyl-carrier-protein] S-malonyltransferase